MPFDFRSLNLGEVETSSGSQGLKPGRYVCKIDDVKLGDTKRGGKNLEIKLVDVGGAGSIRYWINLQVPSSPEATRIGLEQLKAVLVHGNHPNPNQPGDIATMRGLTLGVAVVEEKYTKDGEERTGGRVSYVFPQDDGAESPSHPYPESVSISGIGQDRIPF